MTKLYRFLQCVFKPIYKLFFGLKAEGLENEPTEGACIICANHISMHDIFFIGVNLKRQIYFFAKKELFKNPILAKILRSFGTISVNRGMADLKAINATIDVLKDGKYVGLFPQAPVSPTKNPIPTMPRAASVFSRTEQNAACSPYTTRRKITAYVFSEK